MRALLIAIIAAGLFGCQKSGNRGNRASHGGEDSIVIDNIAAFIYMQSHFNNSFALSDAGREMFKAVDTSIFAVDSVVEEWGSEGYRAAENGFVRPKYTPAGWRAILEIEGRYKCLEADSSSGWIFRYGWAFCRPDVARLDRRKVTSDLRNFVPGKGFPLGGPLSTGLIGVEPWVGRAVIYYWR